MLQMNFLHENQYCCCEVISINRDWWNLKTGNNDIIIIIKNFSTNEQTIINKIESEIFIAIRLVLWCGVYFISFFLNQSTHDDDRIALIIIYDRILWMKFSFFNLYITHTIIITFITNNNFDLQSILRLQICCTFFLI